ncbi:MAG: hypothetical protein HY459_02845 [Parcubacteria group bacterium]|nr:hypothetical protein [Parcubacteria group bacterium]
MSELKSFYDASTDGETLGARLPDGTYVFQLDEAEVDEWDDGRPRLTVSTRVVAGEYEGMYGPRIQLSVGESSGVVKATGKPFTISEEDAALRLRVTVKAIHPTPIRMRNPNVYDAAMLEDIAAALSSRDEFIGTIRTRKDSEYANFSRIYPVDEPPKKFVDPRRATAFSLPPH